MKRIGLTLLLLMLFCGYSFADATAGKEKQPDRWQMLSDVERRKGELFAEYQSEKQRLQHEYDDALQLLEKDQPEDIMRQKIRLQKSYKSQKSRLLNDFRKYNLALEKREAALKGRRYVPHRELDTMYRLRRGSAKESILGTSAQAKPKRKNYLKSNSSGTSSYTSRTKLGISNMKYRNRR